MSYSNDTKVLKSCDYITLDVKNTDAWQNATGTDEVGEMQWFIPNGAYKSVIETPHITTVEYISGGFRGNSNDIGIVVRYVNGAMNHFIESREAPPIAYGNVRASNSPVFISTGEAIVNDRPNFIKIKLTQVNGDPIIKNNLLGFTFTLKYSYYESKKV